MKALVAAGDGTVELAEVPAPLAANGQLLVAARAISLNRGELHRLQGARSGWRPGWDFAGVVAALGGGIVGPAVGARVFGTIPEGAWAERIAVSAAYLAPLPDELSFAQGAALPVAGLTALRVLALADRPLDGARGLVVGAAGGVGRRAVQLAHRFGAAVTAAVGSEERCAGLAALGADQVVVGIDSARDRYDVILESAGGESLARALSLVAAGGTVVTFGNSSRTGTWFLVNDFYAVEGVLRGLYLWRDAERCPPADDLARLAAMIAAGSLTVDVDLCRPWQDGVSALERLRERAIAGKAVLTLDADGGGHG